jgi:methanogenic corrinoid protein MtbC1
VKTLAGVGAATVALGLGGALVLDRQANTADAAELVSYAATTAAADSSGLREQLKELMANDEFRAELNTLRDGQQEAADAWWDKYGEDPDSDEAREARKTLREQQRSQMSTLLEKYGVDTAAMEQAREDAKQAREQLRELLANDEFRAELNTLRDAQQEAMDAWWDKYGEDPDSDEAREARETLREDAASAMQELAAKYGVELPEGQAGFRGKRGGGFMGGGMMGPGGGFRGGMPPADNGTTTDSEETTTAALSI